MTAPCDITLDHGVVDNGRVHIVREPARHKELSYRLQRYGTGRLLGSFPQAYTHVGLINTAVTISELIEARDSRFRAWS